MSPSGTEPSSPAQRPPAATGQPSSHASPGPDDAIVRCMGLTKVFRDFWMRSRVRAVDGINLTVNRGEVFGLLGPNGSGKSTTIKMILGLLYPTAGRIAIFGKRPEGIAIKRLIGYLPEESNLYPFLTARETLDYYGRLFHQPRRQRRARIDALLEMVGLEAIAHRPIGQYSKGMQRRIGLAQALINDPRLLILDEPTNGLDPIGTHQIKDLILELARREKTILLCSHLLADVEDVCDRVAIMFGGRVCATGSIEQLLVQRGVTALHVPDLDPAMIQKVEVFLEANGRHIEKVEKPRQKLEALFLDIVHKAQAKGLTTSGAQLGGSIAAFLKQDHSPIPSGAIAAQPASGSESAPAAMVAHRRAGAEKTTRPAPQEKRAVRKQKKGTPPTPTTAPSPASDGASLIAGLTKPPPDRPPTAQAPKQETAPPPAAPGQASAENPVIDQLVTPRQTPRSQSGKGSSSPIEKKSPPTPASASTPPVSASSTPMATDPKQAPPPPSPAPKGPQGSRPPRKRSKPSKPAGLPRPAAASDVPSPTTPPASPSQDEQAKDTIFASALSDQAQEPAKPVKDPKPSPPADPLANQKTNEEKPDQSFLHAIDEVPPFDPSANKE